MSALPLKADIASLPRYVRSVPRSFQAANEGYGSARFHGVLRASKPSLELHCLVRWSWRLLRDATMSPQPSILAKTVESLADAVYPSFAMLAGMELDLFTPLKDGSLTAEEIAQAAGTDRAKTAPLLHALVAIGLLKSDGGRFLNSPEADRFLVRGRPDYIG